MSQNGSRDPNSDASKLHDSLHDRLASRPELSGHRPTPSQSTDAPSSSTVTTDHASSSSSCPRRRLSFNRHGQCIGENSVALATLIGRFAMANVSPLYPSWNRVPTHILDLIWHLIQDHFEITDDHRDFCLQKASIAWRNWKYRLGKKYRTSGITNAQCKMNKPKRWVKQEDWEMFVDLKSTPEEYEKSLKYVNLRGKMKAPHNTGRKGIANRAEELRKTRSDGSQPSRSELYISSHTGLGGTSLTPELSNTIFLINELISLDPTFGTNDLDNDAVAKVCGKDRKGRVRGLGGGISKTAMQYIAPKQIEIQKLEGHVFNMSQQLQNLTEKLNSVPQSSTKSSSQYDVGSSFEGITSSHYPAPRGQRCNLCNLHFTKIYAHGILVRVEVLSLDYYHVLIDEIFDMSAQLHDKDVAEGMTFANIDIGSIIRWPRMMIDIIS